MRTPSSASVRASGGSEPGAMPPISAWCARLAVKNAGRRVVAREDRRDDRHVGQVAAAPEGVVGDVNLAGAQVGHVVAQAAHAFLHRAEMHGDVRGVGDERGRGVEERAGEIQPLLDVGGQRRALERRAHLFGDRGETAVEEFEFDGVGAAVGGGVGENGRPRVGPSVSWEISRKSFHAADVARASPVRRPPWRWVRG